MTDVMVKEEACMTSKEVRVHVLRCVPNLFTYRGVKFLKFENIFAISVFRGVGSEVQGIVLCV